jgi:hypothetical protein
MQDIIAGARASSPMGEKEHVVGKEETGEERESPELEEEDREQEKGAHFLKCLYLVKREKASQMNSPLF